MRTRSSDDADFAGFAPRVTIMLAAGVLLFLCVSLLYVLPVLLEPAPAGAIADWHKEQVQARLQGKVLFFLIGSFLFAAFLAMRGLLPGTRRKRR